MEAKYPKVGGFGLLSATDVIWSPWSAPESSGGVKATEFTVIVKDGSGKIIVPEFKTLEGMINVCDLKPTEPFKEKEKYMVGITPHFKDGDGEYGEFEVVFDDLSELTAPPAPAVNPVPDLTNPPAPIAATESASKPTLPPGAPPAPAPTTETAPPDKADENSAAAQQQQAAEKAAREAARKQEEKIAEMLANQRRLETELSKRARDVETATAEKIALANANRILAREKADAEARAATTVTPVSATTAANPATPAAGTTATNATAGTAATTAVNPATPATEATQAVQPTPWTTQQMVFAGVIAIIALLGLVAIFMAVMPKAPVSKQASGGTSSYVPPDFAKRFADMTGPVPVPANGATSSETRGTPTVPKIGKTSVDQTTVPKNAISGNGNVIGILGNVTGNSNTSITINNYPARHTMAHDGISVPSGLNRSPDADGVYRWKMEIGSDTSLCYTIDSADWLLSFEATAVESDITIHVRGHDGVWQPVKLGANIGSINCTGLRFTMKRDARESADLSFVLSIRK